VLSAVGEDTIYHCECNKCDFSQNEEIFKGSVGDKCKDCDCKIKASKAIEVGNIFPLGTMYAEKMGAFYTDSDGARKPLWLASYGIGPTRILGTLVELFHDERGIIWPESVAPYKVNLIVLHSQDEAVLKFADKVYEDLIKAGVEVLYDDRLVAAGEKFGDSDLIGLPVRLVVSSKTLSQASGKIEFKKRHDEEAEILTFEEILKKLK